MKTGRLIRWRLQIPKDRLYIPCSRESRAGRGRSRGRNRTRASIKARNRAKSRNRARIETESRTRVKPEIWKPRSAEPSEVVLMAELSRTGVALETVLERYGLDDLSQMTQDIYGKAMAALKQTKPKAVAPDAANTAA